MPDAIPEVWTYYRQTRDWTPNGRIESSLLREADYRCTEENLASRAEFRAFRVRNPESVNVPQIQRESNATSALAPRSAWSHQIAESGRK
jgi:hypothetical protein